MELKIVHYLGIMAGFIVFAASFFFLGDPLFFFLMGIGVIIGVSPFMITIIIEARIAEEKEQMFIEFSRNLVESVKAGTPVSKSILNLKNKPYGVLTEHVKKLANQITLGIPFSVALQIFARDVDNRTVSRSLTLIGQAEKAGGNIGEILEAVAQAVTLSDKLKKERKSSISTLVVQGYIIFFVFLVIILVMQFRILPLLTGIGDIDTVGSGGSPISGVGGLGGGASEEDAQAFANSFLYLLLIQGFFSGLVIGLLSEANFKAGLKHSFSLMIVSFLIASGANVFFEPGEAELFLPILSIGRNLWRKQDALPKI